MASGLLGSLGYDGEDNSAPMGGLFGSLRDPEKFAALAMIVKGLSPYSEVDPTALLKLAQAQKEHAINQQFRRQQLDLSRRAQDRADEEWGWKRQDREDTNAADTNVWKMFGGGGGAVAQAPQTFGGAPVPYVPDSAIPPIPPSGEVGQVAPGGPSVGASDAPIGGGMTIDQIDQALITWPKMKESTRNALLRRREKLEAAQQHESKHSLTPIYGEGGQIGTLNDRGEFKQIPTGDFKPMSPGTFSRDTGTSIEIYDRAGNVISSRPKDVAGAAAEKQRGEAAGKVQAALPNTLAKAEQSIGLIDEMIAHPGRETATGLSSVLDPRNYIPGTEAKDFQIRAKQLKGRVFLEAYETLKGGGQITEIEGAKGEAALARMDTAASDKEYLQALKDFRSVLKVGMERAKRMAAPVSPGNNPPQVEEKPDPLGIR